MATAHDELQMWLQTPTEGQELSLSLSVRQILIEPAQKWGQIGLDSN